MRHPRARPHWSPTPSTRPASCPKPVVLLDEGILADPNELFLLETLAHEYGHHIQRLTGVNHALDAMYPGKMTAKQYYTMSRRVELQAECYSGVFAGSVWSSLGRDEYDFTSLIKTLRGDYDIERIGVSGKRDYDLLHGKRANIAYWLNKGFEAVAPGACDTWSAPAKRVA